MMKPYSGSKSINAEPMNRLDYNLFRGWELPADECGEDEGYLVEDPGAKANTLRYAGYISWLPQDVFEITYHEVKPTDFRQRVIDEKAELDDRLAKLTAFLPTSQCLSLPFEERGRLSQQHRLMGLLSMVLGERIEAFK